MPNSSIIEEVKVKVQNALLNDDLIVKAIDSTDTDPDNPSELIGTHIFTFAQNPHMIQTSGTYLTIQVHIPQYDTSCFGDLDYQPQ